jgi:hypothetical protein
MENYKTPLLDKINALENEGFSAQFKLEGEELKDTNTGEKYTPKQLKLVKEFRFEGISNPDDMSILYALEAEDGTKGTVVDSYGTYADIELGEFLNKIGKRVQ